MSSNWMLYFHHFAYPIRSERNLFHHVSTISSSQLVQIPRVPTFRFAIGLLSIAAALPEYE